MGVVWYQTFVKANCFQREMHFLSSPLQQQLFVACRDIHNDVTIALQLSSVQEKSFHVPFPKAIHRSPRASSTNEITESCERSQSKGDRVKQMQFYLFCQRDGAIQTRRRAQIKINFFQTAQRPRAAPLGARIFWFVIGESGSVGQVWGWRGGGSGGTKKINSNNNHTEGSLKKRMNSIFLL